MKTLLFTLSLALAAMSSAHAEIYRPSVVGNTTVLGAVAGALIGGHNNDRWAEGALIGGAAGALVGVAIDQSQPRVYRRSEQCAPTPECVSAPAPVVYVPVPSHRAQVVYVNPYPRGVVISRPVVYVSNGRHYRRDRDHWRD